MKKLALLLILLSGCSRVPGFVFTPDNPKPTFTEIEGWGDSLTLGVGGTVSYLVPLSKLMGNIPFVNLGIGGETADMIRARFDADPAHHQYPIFWIGRNGGFENPDAVIRDAAYLIGHAPNCLILSVINGNIPGDRKGNQGYANMLKINAFEAKFLYNYVNVRKALIDSYNPNLPQDVQDVKDDTVPDSLRFNDAHLNDVGYQIVAVTVHNKQLARGY